MAESNRLIEDWELLSLFGTSIHLWVVDLHADRAQIQRSLDGLSPDERVRADGFKRACDRRRFIMARARLRQILGRYVDESPDRLRFGHSEHGKPGIVAPPSDLTFNISHSDDLAVLGFSRSRKLGVDVEWIRPDIDVEGIAQTFFSASEIAQHRELPSALRPEAFYRCWCCKEAFVKARGEGLSLRLADFDVLVSPTEPARIVATRPDVAEARGWTLRAFQPREGCWAALAVEAPSVDLTILDGNGRVLFSGSEVQIRALALN